MAELFDKITGTTTSYDSDGVTDSSASWTTNQFTDWYATINSVEYKITGNTATKLFFENSISDDYDYSIEFVGRTKLTEIESDCSNTTKIPSALISKKYEMANIDLHNKIYAYLRSYITTDFDPMSNILNLICMQQVFAYYLLAKIYQDLSIDPESFEAFKGYNMYEKSFNDNIKDALSMLQVDFDEDGTADASEKQIPASSTIFYGR